VSRLLTLGEAAELLGVSRGILKRLIQRGAVRASREFEIPSSEVARILAKRAAVKEVR